MAITGESESWNEDAIMALYTNYQETRDGVDYRHYRGILKAAKEQSTSVRASVEMEKRISAISSEACRLYPPKTAFKQSEEKGSRDTVDQDRNTFAAWKEHISRQITEFIESISPARLVPVAATLALIAAITPFVLDTDSQSGALLSEEIALLDQYQSQAAQELERLGGFQHGFSAFNRDTHETEGGYATAFASGVILVDIQSIDADKNASQLVSLVDSISVAPIVKQSLQNHSGSLPDRVQVAQKALHEHYRDDQYQPVFLLGQWVESAYLLSRVAIINRDSEVMVTALDSLPEVSAMLEKSGYLSPRLQKDFDRLGPFHGRNDLTREEVSKVSAILLKLRTLEPQVQG